MQLAYEALKFLRDGRFHSGNNLALDLKVSRTSIWKAIQFLENLGLAIYAVPGKGYRLAEPLEMLQKTEIYSLLSPQAQEYVTQLDVLNLTTSTNDYLVQRAHPNLLSGYACVAEGQTQGRGRLGRKWLSPFGANLYFSLYWHFNLKPVALSGLSLVVGIAALKAIQSLTGNTGVTLKWPNDLYNRDAKLGGILIETIPCSPATNPAFCAAIIGIGLNVSQSSTISLGANRPVTALENIIGYKLSRNTLVAELLNQLVPALEAFQSMGFSAFKSTWEKYDYLMDRVISLSLPKGPVVGRVVGVNDRGELCLEVSGQKRAFQCGEATVILD